MKKIGIIGCGAFGYALALLLAKTHQDLPISVYDVDKKYIEGLQQHQRHPFFYPELTAPKNIQATLDLSSCMHDADLIILAVPAQFVRSATQSIKPFLSQEAIILNIAKALEEKTNVRMSEVIKEVLGELANPIATLSGGMLAGDIAYGYPVGADIGSKHEAALVTIKKLFMPSTVHVEITTDIAAVEYGGAFKNVIAIGAGIIDGLGLGVSSKAFFVAQSLKEIEHLAIILGADYKSMHTSSNAWIGDIMTTSFGDSRNRYFGELIGKGTKPEKALAILKDQRKHAEGYITLHVMKELIDHYHVKSPFLMTTYDVVYNNCNAKEKFEKIALFQHLTS